MSIVGVLPSTIKNGDLEDATVVMSLFSFIQSQVNANACPATVATSVLKGDGAGSTVAAVPFTDYLTVQSTPFRNRVINGNCFEDQRNSGAAQTIVAGAALAYCVDRFYGYCTGANATGQQVAAADGTKRYRFTGAASVTGIGFGHRIEAANSLDLAGNTCTFSTKQANSLLTTVNWAAYYANTNDTFGTLASPTRTAIASGSFTVNATEALYSAQIAVPAAATTGIEIVLSVGAQTSGTWTNGEIQIEKGAIPAAAISFERVDVAANKARCQRYLPAYLSSGTLEDAAWGGFISTSAAIVDYQFPVEPRVAPAGITVSSPGHFSLASMASGSSTVTALTFANAGKRMCRMVATGTGTPYTSNQPACLQATSASGQILFTGCEL